MKRTLIGIGFVGDGPYKTRIDGSMTNAYIAWRDMIHRCYNPKLREKYNTYNDCMVDDRWHNFQNFAKWFSSSKFSERGYHLDKDLLVRGNKTYGPDNCCLLPPALNYLIRINRPNKQPLGKNPLIGATIHQSSGRWRSTISKNGEKVYLGLFDKEIDAHLRYVEEKEQFVREQAEFWRDNIENRAYEALMRWRVTDD